MKTGLRMSLGFIWLKIMPRSFENGYEPSGPTKGKDFH
jgi:hypothetical protein